MVRTRRRVSAVAAGASTLLCLATVSGIVGAPAAGAASSSGRTALAGTVIPAAARQHPVGAVPKSSRVTFDLVLQLRDAAGAQARGGAATPRDRKTSRHYLPAAGGEPRSPPGAPQGGPPRQWLRS